MTNFEPDPVPVTPSNPNPGLVELTPAGRSPLAEAQDREQRRWNQTRTVRMVCTTITVSCGPVRRGARRAHRHGPGRGEPGQRVAAFVRGLGRRRVIGPGRPVHPGHTKTQVLLNSGLAALAWLALGAVATMLIRRFAYPAHADPAGT